MTFALNQMFWLDGVFLWTNHNSFNINKSFNKTIVDSW
jgi:hypothetical protein